MSTKISLLLCLALLSTGCSLDEHPRDQIPEQEAYATPHDLFMNTVATLYNYIGGNTDGQGLQGTCRGVYDLQTFGSDEAMLPTRGGDWFDGGIWEDMYMHAWDAGHELPKNAWLYLYKVINLCNRSLEILEDHQDMLAAFQYQAYTAEVRALRAIYYWYLLGLFGRVPIITTTETPMNEVLQSERSEVFRFVVKELTETFDDLKSEKSTKPGDFYGRVTMPVAFFVMAKLMLNAEVYLDDNWTDGLRPDGGKMKFQFQEKEMNAWEATIYFCNLISLSGFQLEEHYTTNFQVRNEQSNENIWVIPMDKDLFTTQQHNIVRSLHYRHAAAYGFSGENGSRAPPRPRAPPRRAATQTEAPSPSSRSVSSFAIRPQPQTSTRLRQSVLSLFAISSPIAPSAVTAALSAAKSARRVRSSTLSPWRSAERHSASPNRPPNSRCPCQSAATSSSQRSCSAESGVKRSPPASAGVGSTTQSAPYTQPWIQPAFGICGGSSASSPCLRHKCRQYGCLLTYSLFFGWNCTTVSSSKKNSSLTLHISSQVGQRFGYAMLT